MSRKKVIALTVCALLLVAAVIVFCGVQLLKDHGLQTLKIKQLNSNQLEVSCTFVGALKYEVRYVPEDEPEWIGEHMADYDGSIGKYRIAIEFFDTELSDKFQKQWKERVRSDAFSDVIWNINEEIPGFSKTVKAKILATATHGYIIYIGSDEPLYITEQPRTELKPLGIVRQTITVGDDYWIEREGKQTYLHLPVSLELAMPSCDPSVPSPYKTTMPTFSSVREMRDRIQLGQLTNEQLRWLAVTNPFGEVPICDPDKLYDLCLPENVKVTSVDWHGEYYLVDFAQENSGALGTVICHSQKERYVSAYETVFYDKVQTGATLISQQVDRKTGTRTVYLEADGTQFRDVFYKLNTAKGVMEVRERYVLQSAWPLWQNRVSDTLPWKVNFFGELEGMYYYGGMHGFSEPLNQQWLAQFGIKPLESN